MTPNDHAPQEVSRILREAADGRPLDREALLPLVYERLRAIAARRMSRERAGHTLQPTELVHEAYLRLVGDRNVDWRSRAHFYAAAAEAMRRILVDHARSRNSRKRGGGRLRLPLDVVDLATRDDAGEILGLDEALDRLAERDPRLASIVGLRFFAGLTEQETAQALDVTDRTVRRDWAVARAWLQRELSRE